MSLLSPQPVSQLGLTVMALGFFAFMAALLMARLGKDGEGAGGKRSQRSILGVAIQMAGFVFVGNGHIAATLDPDSRLAWGEAGAILVLMALTIGLFVAATRAMGRNWSIVARTRADHELVTWGPFALIRHPIYSGLFAFMLALAVAFGHWGGLILGVPLYWWGTWLRIAEEESLLRAQFGASYDAYAARVKRFVPGVI